MAEEKDFTGTYPEISDGIKNENQEEYESNASDSMQEDNESLIEL